MSNQKNTNIIKTRIKEERIKLGLTQVELSKKIGKGNSAVSSYELGERIPPTDILILLADLFDCSVDYLLGRTDNRDIIVYKTTLEGQEISYGIDRHEKDQPDSEEKLMVLTRKLKAIGFDVDKLLSENINLDK